MAREKYSVAGRFSRPPLENLKDGCVTAMKKEKSPPEVKRPQTGRECNNKGTDCSALDVTVLFQFVITYETVHSLTDHTKAFLDDFFERATDRHDFTYRFHA